MASGVNPTSEFCAAMTAANQQLLAGKLPLDGIRSFSMEGTKFTVLLDSAYTGKVSYLNTSDKASVELMKDVSVRVSKKVTGTIDAVGKSVRLDPECFVASKKTSLGFIPITTNISLTEIKTPEDDKAATIAGKWGILPEQSQEFSPDKIVYTSIDWKKA